MLSARLGTEQAPCEPSLRDTQTLSKAISLTGPRSQSIRRTIHPEVDPPVTGSSEELSARRWDGNRRWSLPGRSVASLPSVSRTSRTNPWAVFLTARRLCLQASFARESRDPRSRTPLDALRVPIPKDRRLATPEGARARAPRRGPIRDVVGTIRCISVPKNLLAPDDLEELARSGFVRSPRCSP